MLPQLKMKNLHYKPMILNFDTAIQGLKSNSCPNCHNSIDYDVQSDSIYCNCSCGEFEVSTFRDKFNGSLILFYLNNEDKGGVDQKNLKELQKVLYKNRKIKKQIFSLKIQKQLF